MDHIDRQIVALLSQQGRRSNVEIARELGLSEGTVRKRIDRLLANSVLNIRGLVEPAAVGCHTQAVFFLTAEVPQLDAAMQLLRDMPEVVSIYRLTGEYDLLVEAAFGSDGELADFITSRLSRVPGIVSSKTAHVLQVAKQRHEWIVPGRDTARILLVDDDPDFVETSRIVLEAEGYEVRAAANGAQALRDMIVAPPDLVIMDIMMDGILDGWDATWRIRNAPQLQRVPILVVSSITSTDYLAMMPTDQDNLIDNFLSKPVAPQQLSAEIGRLLQR
jgi:Lrp/AsnC family transcriptional regulator for asnA, asnC and gidA